MTGIFFVRDGVFRKADFGFDSPEVFICSKSHKKNSLEVSISDDGKSLHCFYGSYNLEADLTSDGRLVVSREKDGAKVILKDAFVSIPDQVLNGTFTVRTNNKISVNFISSDFSDFIYSHGILGSLYGDPNGDFCFKSTETVCTDGKLSMVCTDENGTSFAKVSDATYLRVQSSWTESGVKTYKSQLFSLVNPYNLDFSKLKPLFTND